MWARIAGNRAAKHVGRITPSLQRTDDPIAKAAFRLVQDKRVTGGKVDAEVSSLVSQAQKAFGKHRFQESAAGYKDALGAVETAADSRHILRSLAGDLEAYSKRFHLLPWNKPEKVAKHFEQVLGDAQKVAVYGDFGAVIEKSKRAMAAKNTAEVESLFQYAKDLATRIWFPFDRRGLSPAKRASLTGKVEKGSWAMAEHYLAAGDAKKAAPFIASANAPTISRPSFDRALKEVDLMTKHGAIRDFTEAQAWELALQARNKFRYNGRPIEETQGAMLELLSRSLTFKSKTMPPESIVANLLTHARTADEVESLLTRAAKQGYKVDLKRDILAAIKTPPLAGVTMNGTNAKVQSIAPEALVAAAEKHGFGAEAGAVLNLALDATGRGYRAVEYRPVGLGAVVAGALGL